MVLRAELHVTTGDGHSLAVRHLRPELDDENAPSLILLHGFAQNHQAFDLPGRSLAEWLAGQGNHVFVGELRGRSTRLPHHLHRFSDYVETDAPALIDAVLGQRPNAPVIFIGHSMGALIGGSLPDEVAARVHALALLAPPLHFLSWFGPLRVPALIALRRTPEALKLPLPTRVAGPLLHASRGLLDAAWMPLMMPVWAPGSVEPHLLQAALHSTFAHEGPLVLADLLQLGLTRGEQAGTVPVGTRLRALRQPLLVGAGDTDGLAPPRVVRPLFEMAGSARKRLVVFGAKAGGSRCGHLDMLVGKHAPGEVWPELLAFIHEVTRPGSHAEEFACTPSEEALHSRSPRGGGA